MSKNGKCQKCFEELQGFILDRLVVMTLDVASFVKKEREIEKFLIEMQRKIDEKNKTLEKSDK